VISEKLLDYLRSVSDALLPDTAAILRYTESNTADGVVETWQTIASGIACRVDMHRATATERGGGAGAGSSADVFRAISDWMIHLPALTDVTERDRITVTSTGRTDNRTFEVTAVEQMSYEATRNCICTLVT